MKSKILHTLTPYIKKGASILCAAALLFGIPMSMADAGDQAPAVPGAPVQGEAIRGDPFRGGFGRGGFVDTSTLTAEQRTAYDVAQAALQATEDGLLKQLVEAGLVTQVDADAYAAMRSAAPQSFQGQPPQGEPNGRGQQSQAIRQDGQGAPNGPGGQGGPGNLFGALLQNDSSVAQSILNQWQAAQQTYQEALTAAGIAPAAPQGAPRTDSNR